ncbi:GNAT family N-acetyltransferase [Polaromonas sp.]|uniref:GNAT family N-acetyltransferase n=1 Tax=Polaromonas sp. TaxID=1869339 RepID=UPI003C984B2B
MQQPEFPELETPRLRLIELDHQHAPALLAIHQDAHHMRHWGAKPFANVSAAHEFISACRAGWKLQVPVMRWALQHRATGEFLGTCGLFNWDQRWQKCFLGYELNPNAQRQGLMREALKKILTWGFERGQLHRVEALIHPDNQASLGLAAQLGFQVEGRLREVAFWNETRHDMLQLGLLQPEWQP